MKWGFILVLLIAAMCAAAVLADPVGPNQYAVTNSSRRDVPATGIGIQGIAGNVSELSLNATTITTGWQGYFGDVTGTIVLDDALNNSMYSWDLANPKGEVFATRDSDGVNWGSGNIICASITNVESEETALNFNSGSVSNDGINETFSYSNSHPSFSVSANSFAADQCKYTVSTYVNDAPGARSFNETLLYSTSDTSLIYAALIFPGGSEGFKLGADTHDFQMLVAEDGHNGDAMPTNYYFYVELE